MTTNENSNPKKNRRQTIKFAYEPGKWFQFPKVFLSFLPADHANLLAYLVNHTTIEQSEELNGGWFTISMEKIKEELFIRRDKQTRMFTNLREQEILFIAKKGIPSKRWIKINYITIYNLIKEKTKDPLPPGRSLRKKSTEDQKVTTVDKLVEKLGIDYIAIKQDDMRSAPTPYT